MKEYSSKGDGFRETNGWLGQPDARGKEGPSVLAVGVFAMANAGGWVGRMLSRLWD